MPPTAPTANGAPAESEGLYPALGRLPSGLYILTIGDGDDATGMLVSWVQQAGFEPPMLSLALKTSRPITDRVTSGEPFVVSIIPDGDKSLLKHFGKGFAPGEPAFEGLETVTTAVGTPAPAGAIAYLECRCEQTAPASDHIVVVAHVTGGRLLSSSPPAVHTRKRGDHY